MAIGIALLVTYLICLIVAGHGAAPLGLLLFVGGLDSWFIVGKIIGWLGILGMLLGTFCLRQKSLAQLVLQLVSAIFLCGSWFDIARRTDNESGSFATTAIFSIPFLVASLVSVFWLIAKIKKSLAGTRAP
jgi:hypothetical protein